MPEPAAGTGAERPVPTAVAIVNCIDPDGGVVSTPPPPNPMLTISEVRKTRIRDPGLNGVWFACFCRLTLEP